MRYKILHITAHMGGGLGTVLWNWIKTDEKNTHRVLCLNRNYYNEYDNRIVLENMKNRPDEIMKQMELADLVVVHFWNHPFMYEFLLNRDLPPCRMCVWAHVSGLKPPYVFPEKLLDMADQFVFASPISYKAKEIVDYPNQDKFKQIWTTGNIDEYLTVKRVKHESFNIGFVGTLDYSKVHPKFIELCSKINIPNAQFIIIGDGCDALKMKQEVKDRGMEDRFVFTGVINDIKPYLAVLDVFGYPLNPDHFGTCEQVIGEAIAAGVIPVCMKNPAEEFILYRSMMRFACEDEEEYVRSIELLYNNRCKRDSILNIIQDSIVGLYDTDEMIDAWEDVFVETMGEKKSYKFWMLQDEATRANGNQMFIESLGKHGEVFRRNDADGIRKLFSESLQWRSSSKGSPKQYLDAFPNNKLLKCWSEIADE